jgi:predicted phosphodiesterase
MPDSFPTVRDPLLSVLQSAAAAVMRRRAEAVPTGPADHPLSAAVAQLATARADPTRAYSPPGNIGVPASTCAGLGLELLEALVFGNSARRQDLKDRLSFSQCDPLWAETLAEYATTLQPDGSPCPIPYIRYNNIGDFVLTALAVKIRVGLVSDWGTGTQVARRVADLLARQQPDVVIHLGDIYYSGTPDECTQHFYNPMRAALPSEPIFTLSGNHDMYSGGQGYYGLLKQIGQPASYFCLRSPDNSWQILAADTGLNDRNPIDVDQALTRLDPLEEAWHADKLRGFPGRTIFLTHHQPFSAFAQIGALSAHSPVNPNLMASFARLAQAGRIDAWFWGHEHRLRLYAPYHGIAAGRNIGYGAIPVEASPGPAIPLPGLIDPPVEAIEIPLDVVDGAYAHGFAVLDLSRDGILASYWAITQPDAPVYQESLGGSPSA